MKMCFRLMFVLAAMIAAFTSAPSAHAQAGGQPYFMIVNKKSGRAMDLIAGSLANGAAINQYTYDYNSNNQHWAILPTEAGNHFKLISQVSGKVACIAQDSTAPGAVLYQWDYTGNNPAQQWDLIPAGNGWFKIKNVKSGLMLGVSYGSVDNNQPLLQWNNNGQPDQLWRLQPWGDYFIQAASGRYVCVEGMGSTNGSRIIQYDYENNPWFKWRFQSATEGFVQAASLNALSRCLCVQAGSFDAGRICHLWDYNPNNVGDQKMWILPLTNGLFKFYFAHDGMSFDIPGGQTANNVPLTQYPNNGNIWQQFALRRNADINSVYSVPTTTIPAPTGSGVMSFRVLNGTQGVYANTQVYWLVIGQDPANGNRWSYLDLNGNLLPISNALNNAPGHLVKNGRNFANIAYTISQKQWISLPKITAGRLYLSVGEPVYITTYDNGFAGPDINNPSDANVNVYFDFIEFTVDNTGYHGNTTRVDMFGFPVQTRLVSRSGNFDRAVGELEFESRAGIFAKYQAEVPNEFKSLATDQAPYRIVAPLHGSFGAGKPNGNYFASYAPQYTTQDIIGASGPLASNAALNSAINRHVYTLAQSEWTNVSSYYLAGPANYYAAFWHRHAIDNLAYGMPYDDYNGQAAYVEVGDPRGLIIRVGW